MSGSKTGLDAIDVQVCFWNLCRQLEFQPAVFAVAAKETEHCFRMTGKIGQGLLDRHR